MLNKSEIENLKQNDLQSLYKLIHETISSKELVFILSNLGHLPKSFDSKIFEALTKNSNAGVRYWAVKNIGKLSNTNYLDMLFNIAKTDSDSLTKREAVSSIGRMRSRKTIPFLVKILNDDDPKIVLQAIRGLIVFKNDEIVKKELKNLKNHPNEVIRTVLNKEFKENPEVKSTITHIESPHYLQNVVVNGDVLDVLQQVPDESVHLTFTSPPYYNARDYSIYKSYQVYLDFLTEVFQEVYRITKEGRFFVLNTSPIIIPRMSRSHASIRYPIPFDLHGRLINIGWEFIDDIIWLKPETSVKNRNAGFLQHRKPLGYKPNPVTEYLMVYRKKTDKLLDWNMHQYPNNIVEESKVYGDYETSNVWRIDPTFDKVHSAVFPLELCNRVISFYSYKGDLIFDPFGGSGTVGRSARQLERNFFLTEIDYQYFERIKTTLGNWTLLEKPKQQTRFYTLNEFCELEKGE